MTISKYNNERYLDLTAYEALSAIDREIKKENYKPLIFICSPFAGDIEDNLMRARRYCQFALSQNTIPIAPHLLFPQFMDDSCPKQRKLAIFMGLVLLSKCKELWYFGDRISPGMSMEISKALKRGITIRHFGIDCMEVEDE